jgi:hypothetical protein
MDFNKLDKFKKKYNIMQSKPPISLLGRRLYKQINNLDKCLSFKELEFNFFDNLNNKKFDRLFDHVLYFKNSKNEFVIVTNPYLNFEDSKPLFMELEQYFMDHGVNCKVEVFDKDISFYGFSTIQGVLTIAI